MTVSLMLITHNDIGTALLEAAKATLGDLPLPATVVPIHYHTDPEKFLPKLQQFTHNIENGEGLLILTDLYGSTPSNIAKQLQDNPRIRIVSGLNLPMLIRVMNYPNCNLNALAEKALSGGRDGIVADEEIR